MHQPSPEEASVEEHLLCCVRCQRRAAAVDREIAVLRALLQHTEVDLPLCL